MDESESVVERLERYFRLAALRCDGCGEFHGDPAQDEAEWYRRMWGEMDWILNDQWAVLSVLPAMEREWSEACDSVRALLRQADSHGSASLRNVSFPNLTVSPRPQLG